jgi:hypothetical protein
VESLPASRVAKPPSVARLALEARRQDRIILTSNVKDFRPLLRDDSPGVIGIPETWSADRVDTKLTALLMQHGPNYFKGRFRALGAVDAKRQVA